MNEIEQEAVILNIAWGMIDEMINWGMIVKYGDEPLQQVVFKTAAHARLCNVLLGDFLSPLRSFKGNPPPFGLRPAPNGAKPSDLTFLFYLRQVCADPRLAGDASLLSAAVEGFAEWLEGSFVAVDAHLPNVSITGDVAVQRMQYLKICGDIAKHNVARLEANARHIRRILSASGHVLSEQDSFLAIGDFYEWFHDDIFIGHASVIGDYLNEIRRGIDHYLLERFSVSYVRTNEPVVGMYRYEMPAGIVSPSAQALYWELMNRVRQRPWMGRFAILDGLRRML